MCLASSPYLRRDSGVFEAVKIRKSGFPFRLKHAPFVERYGCIMDREGAKNGTMADCKKITSHAKLPDDNVRCTS